MRATRPDHCAGFIPRFELLIHEIIPELRRLDLPAGLVHGDIFPDNTLFQRDQLVAVLDFGQVCRDAFLFDVAMTLHGFCIDQNNHTDVDTARAFVSAYQSQRPLTDAEKSALPLYLRWCPLAMAAWHFPRFADNPNARQKTRIRELLDRADNHFSIDDIVPA